ncbi:MAG: Spectrin beta chain, non-erythrocytic 1, partial [Paramarteilia canceri]
DNDKHHSLKKRNDSDLSKFNMNLLSMHLSNLNDEANKLDKGTPKIESDGIKIHNRLNSLNKKLSSVDTNTIFTSSSIEMRESFSKIETELKRNRNLLKKLSSDFNDTVSKDQNNTCSLSIFKISTEIIKSESDSLDAVDFEKLDQNDKKIYSNLVKEKQKILNDLDELNLKIEEVEKAIKTDSELNNYVNQLDTVSEYNKNLKQSLNNLLEKKNVLVSTMGNDTHFELYELNDSKNKLDDNLYAVQHKIKEIESNLDVKETRKHPILKKICNKLNVVSNEWKNIFMNVDSIGNIIEAWKNSKQYNEKLDLVASFINDSNQEISQDLTPENLTAKKIILKQFKQLLHDMRLEVTHKMLLSGSSDGEFAYACLQKVSDRIVENEWGLSATLNKLEDLSVNQLSAKPLNIFESKIKNCENIITNIMNKANNAPQFSILALKNTENVLKEIYLEGVNHLQNAKHNRFTIEKELEKLNHLLKKVSTDIDLIEINYKSEGINEASGYKMLLEIEAIENFLLRGNDFLRSFPQIIKNALVDFKASKENLSVLKKKIDSNSFRDYPSLHERAISLLAKLPEILDDHIVSGSRYLNNLTLQSNKRLRNHIESVISDKIQILNKAPKFNQVLMNEAGIEEEFKDIILCYSDQRDTDSDILSKFLKDLQNRKLPLFNCEYILSLFEQISMFKWVDSLDFLSSITHKCSNEILDIPVKELQEELQEENAFSFTIAAWLRDSQLSWNSLFEQINSQKYKLDSHHLTSKVVYENQFLLANISVIEKHLLDLIQKHSESPAAQIPDIRKDIAGLEPTVHQSIDDARHLYSKADISSTNILKKITIKLASRYQHLYEKSKLLNFSVKLDSNWRNFQLLDVRLRQHLSNLMLKVATVSFDKNNDENIFVAQTEVQLLKATADSLQPIFDTILSLAKEMIQQKHESHSQIRQLVLSLTSKRADLMQMLEDLKIMLMDAVEISLKHHDRQIYEISETITNTQLDFLQSQCQALSSKPDLDLIKNELSNIHQSEVIADLAQDEYSPLLKISPIKKKNIRDIYVVDLSSYNLNKSTEKKKYDDNKLNKLSIGNIKNIMKIKNKSKKSQNNLLTGSTTKFSHTNIDQFEGKLMHKIITFEDESDYHLKKMIKKHSWESVHCILTFGLLLVYTDGIEAEKMPEHPLYSLELIDCECARIDGSQKGKANIFSIKNVDGNFEALYQAKTAVECETWLSMLSYHSSHSNKTKNSFEESEKSAV